MTSQTPPLHTSRRYQILGEIGSGGMGIVYHAYDRLTGEEVALKQVTEPADDTIDTVSHDSRMSLASEFRLLASLRHPNVISVIDYGFSTDPATLDLPYYTMEYLPDARWLTQTTADMPLEVRLELLVQLLDAIVYVHRRGILHRDLKPGNVLVVNGQVRVVDFGLSTMPSQPEITGEDDQPAGTMPYMAPELLETNQASSVASDLYAVGVMAYEVLAGRHPYPMENIVSLLQAIGNSEPDFSAIDAPENVVDVVRGLMAKDAHHRYDSAVSALADLYRAAGKPPRRSPNAVREGFLQAARFVGRDEEFDTLRGAVDRALDGQGGMWLVGGESGIGKSRLLEELRAYAMVRGAHVLTGQAIREGQVYGLWHDVLRRLCLVADLDDEQAAAIQRFIPGIDRLLDRAISDPDPPKEHYQRQMTFFSAVQHALSEFTRQRLRDRMGQEAQTIVVILEDCHWADSGSLHLLKQLGKVTDNLHLLFVASYRSDESPNLPDELPGFQRLNLGRLNEASIADLSESMIGRAGLQPQVLDMLQRETEGNVFFMVEVMRALAESSGGHLEDIGMHTLPSSVFAGGVRQIVQHRLGRVPESARPLLRTAAVAGRYLDTHVLRHIAPDVDLDSWLNECAGAAVLSVMESGSTRGRWRFAHDKLREALLDELDHDECRAQHLQVARTIEQLYSDRRKEYAVQLAHHWQQVGDPVQEFKYTAIAAMQATAGGANREARRYYARALEIFDEAGHIEDRQSRKLELLIGLGVSMMAARGYATPEVTDVFDRARALGNAIDTDNERLLPVLTLISGYHIARAEYEAADEVGREMVAFAEKIGHSSGYLRGILTIGEAAGFRGEFSVAEQHLRNVVERYDRDKRRAASALQDFGVTAYELFGVLRWISGYPDEALELGRQALGIAYDIKHPISIVFALHWTSIIHFMRGDFDEAMRLSYDTIRLARKGGFSMFYTLGRLYEAICLSEQDEHPGSTLMQMQDAIASYRKTGSVFCLPYFMAKEAIALEKASYVDSAVERIQTALALADQYDEHWFTPEMHRIRGDLILKQTNHLHNAAGAYQMALEMAQRMEARSWALRAATSLAQVRREMGDITGAYHLLNDVYQTFTEGHDTRDLREAKRLLEEFTTRV